MNIPMSKMYDVFNVHVAWYDMDDFFDVCVARSGKRPQEQTRVWHDDVLLL